jgi:hypothetical protein
MRCIAAGVILGDANKIVVAGTAVPVPDLKEVSEESGPE